jgi:hypothetical protein
MELCKKNCMFVLEKKKPDLLGGKDTDDQAAVFTRGGILTFQCKMQEKPSEPDLTEIWEERWYDIDSDETESGVHDSDQIGSARDGFGKCQRVSIEHSICANDYAHYRETPEGMAIIDKYFDDTFAWKGTPSAIC